MEGGGRHRPVGPTRASRTAGRRAASVEAARAEDQYSGPSKAAWRYGDRRLRLANGVPLGTATRAVNACAKLAAIFRRVVERAVGDFRRVRGGEVGG
ncbi:hypothetical protein PT2222_310057 [Paraburkholderia tropica]